MNACFNPYRYDDELICEVNGLEPVSIPLLASVTGSPIRLHDATLGMSFVTTPPTLAWAPQTSSTKDSAQATKTVRVLNHGPNDASLTWGIYKPADPDQEFASSLVVQECGATQLSLTQAPRAILDSAFAPFQVCPLTHVIPAGGERHFFVSFAAGSNVGLEKALLCAELKHPEKVPLVGGILSDDHPTLQLQLRGNSLTPSLEMSERATLKFKVVARFRLMSQYPLRALDLLSPCASCHPVPRVLPSVGIHSRHLDLYTSRSRRHFARATLHTLAA